MAGWPDHFPDGCLAHGEPVRAEGEVEAQAVTYIRHNAEVA